MVDALDRQFHVLDQGKGLAVLFRHGFPDTSETWRNQMLAADSGYRAVAPDIRGYGQSFAPENPDLYTAGEPEVFQLENVLDTQSGLRQPRSPC